MKLIVNAVFAILFFSCSSTTPEQEKVEENTTEVVISDSSAISVDSTILESIIDSTISTYSFNWDSIKQIECYPDYEYATTNNMIQVTNYHSDEVWEGITTEDWYALVFVDDSTCMLSMDGEGGVRQIHDGVVDMSGETTGWEMKQGTGGKVVMYFANLEEYLKEVQVPFYKPEKTLIRQNDSIEFSFLETNYKLAGKGEIKEENGLLSYQLILSSEGKKQLLLALPVISDTFPDILWMGDLDGDNKLDIILETSYHYNLSRPALYLSAPASTNELVK